MTYEINKPLPRLTDIRRLERNERAFKLNKESTDLLKNAIEYYRINYPNSIKNIVWDKEKVTLGIGNGTLEEEIEKLTEDEMLRIYEILEYFHDELQMQKIPDHQKRNRILSVINHTIPGGHFRDQLRGLYKKRKHVQKKIDDLESELEKAREELKARLTEKNIQSKPVCDVCGKVCGNMGALTRHRRTHEK